MLEYIIYTLIISSAIIFIELMKLRFDMIIHNLEIEIMELEIQVENIKFKQKLSDRTLVDLYKNLR